MEIRTLLKANIRKQKRNFIGIVILMFIISVSVISVMTIKMNGDSHISSEVNRIGYGELSIWMNKPDDIDYFTEQLEQNEDVDKVENVQMVCADHATISGSESSNTLNITETDRQQKQYRIYNEACDGYLDEEDVPQLQDQECFVPVSFKSIYDSKIGDQVTVAKGDGTVSYTIKGFFEDPFMGSALMGVKTITVNSDNFRDLYETTRTYNKKFMETATAQQSHDLSTVCVYQVNVYQKADSARSTMDFEKELNTNNLISKYSLISLASSQAQYYTMILINIFSGILIGFAIILMIITMVVMGHSISSSIELEYTNIGILKAIGFQQEKLRIVILLQYFLAGLTGSLAGILSSVLLVRFLNNVMVSTVGLLIPCTIAVVPCLLFITGILALLFLFIILKTRRIMQVSPMLAINGGQDDIYFDDRVRMQVGKRALGLRLAIRQLLSEKKQYISVTIITAFLVFFLVLSGTIGSWIGSDGSGVIQSFTMADYDFNVAFGSSKEISKQEILDYVEDITPVNNSFKEWTMYTTLDGNDCQMHILSDPSAVTSLLSGRLCEYDNEIMITEYIAKQKGLKIGDTIAVGNGDVTQEYMITGLYQCANDTGKNFAISLSGAARLGIDEEDLPSGIYINLVDKTKKQEVVDALNEKYKDQVEVRDVMADWTMISSIADGSHAMRIFVYVVAMIFVVIAVALVCSKIFIREKKDIGIYKAIGFTSSSLRLQFAFRFTLVAVIGCVIGVLVSIFLTQQCVGLLLSAAGITRCPVALNAFALGKPVVFMVVVYFVYAYLLAGKIKRVDPRILITE